MTREYNEYTITDDRSRTDFATVHDWLAATYWSPGVSREIVERAARGSALVVGVFSPGGQVAYARLISDAATFAYICDVYVDEAHRGRGIARAMLRFLQEHPDFQGLRRWVLATADAHDVYAGVGFTPLLYPDRWMVWIPPKPEPAPG